MLVQDIVKYLQRAPKAEPPASSDGNAPLPPIKQDRSPAEVQPGEVRPLTGMAGLQCVLYLFARDKLAI